MTETMSGQDLIDAGLRQGKWFGPALAAANRILESGGSREAALAEARSFEPSPAIALRAADEMPFYSNIEADTPDELANVEAVQPLNAGALAHARGQGRRDHAGRLPGRTARHNSGWGRCGI